MNQELNFTTNDNSLIIKGGCDLFTTKPIQSDRKLYKTIDKHLTQIIQDNEMSRTIERERKNSNSILATSPVDNYILPNRSRHGSMNINDRRDSNVTDNSTELDSIDGSPFGPLKTTKTKWTFANLIAILNTTFPDHDFSNLQPTSDNFHKISYEDLNYRFNNLMISLGKRKEGLDWIWDRIDSHMHLTPQNSRSPTLIPVQNPRISFNTHVKQNVNKEGAELNNSSINDKKQRSNSFHRKLSNSDSPHTSPRINPNQLQNYCQIFEFKPSDQSIIEDLNHPYQTMWSYYWFIYNKKKKKVAFIYLTAINKLHYSLINGNRKSSFNSSKNGSNIIGEEEDYNISIDYDEEVLIDDEDENNYDEIDDIEI